MSASPAHAPQRTVETVRGAVSLDALGPTLMHEHVFILDPGALASFGTHFGPSYWDEDACVSRAIAELQRLRGAGIETIVDPTAYASPSPR